MFGPRNKLSLNQNTEEMNINRKKQQQKDME